MFKIREIACYSNKFPYRITNTINSLGYNFLFAKYLIICGINRPNHKSADLSLSAGNCAKLKPESNSNNTMFDFNSKHYTLTLRKTG